MDYEAPPMPCGCILLLLVFSHSVMSDSFETPWTAAHQAPLPMGFSREEQGSGLPSSNLHLLHWQADSLPLSHQGSSVFKFFDDSHSDQLTG